MHTQFLFLLAILINSFNTITFLLLPCLVIRTKKKTRIVSNQMFESVKVTKDLT